MNKEEVVQKALSGELSEDQWIEIVKVMNVDDAIFVIKEVGFKQSKGQIVQFFKDITSKHTELARIMRDNIIAQRNTVKP